MSALDNALQQRAARIAEAERAPKPAIPGGVDGAVIDGATGIVKRLVFGQAGNLEQGEVLIVGNLSQPGREIEAADSSVDERLAALEAKLAGDTE